ncbi:MAG: hypothetical protein ACMUEL_05000 [Flavobacteriales bacterium Tduv]
MSYFHNRGMKDRIQKKPTGTHSLSRIAILFNKLVSKPRWVVERTFGSIKCLVCIRQGSLQKVSSCAFPASYGGYGA